MYALIVINVIMIVYEMSVVRTSENFAFHAVVRERVITGGHNNSGMDRHATVPRTIYLTSIYGQI